MSVFQKLIAFFKAIVSYNYDNALHSFFGTD